ncbi:hypothetical protein JAAARDRAFT_122756 [Jaapia argillacea MUCL 33604]|uniref:Ubiquitin-like domain-containing protein n=1 Tax=Jaapia argillacea MUCL 33604 TaxID=933084 RepID=A0A067QE38_9AGAM|nr:hypothetical protein JAAARDRAFT_122756 [Jaapia argillacea MUCL 33604]
MFPTPSAEETIFIFIKYPSGTTHTFGPLSYTWPLYFLTHVIEQHEGTPASWQRLTLDGKRILDTDPGTLASVGIKNHSVLELSIVPIKRRAKKPVIYIYPPKEMEVSVEVELKGAWEFETVYPVVPVEKALTGGRKGERILWEVVARRDGTMTEKGTGLEISYLYWEALSIDTPPASRPTSPTEILDAFDAANPNLTSSNSILLHTSSVPAYLDKTLKELGLNVEARTSFITFWLPSFQPHTHIALLFLPQSSYSAAAPLTITPKPDEVLRVFMLFKGINEQNVSLWDAQRTWDWREIVGVGSVVDGSAERFRVVEWGGMEVS